MAVRTCNLPCDLPGRFCFDSCKNRTERVTLVVESTSEGTGANYSREKKLFDDGRKVVGIEG